jgi:large subunit ribosomal protein L7/L12
MCLFHHTYKKKKKKKKIKKKKKEQVTNLTKLPPFCRRQFSSKPDSSTSFVAPDPVTGQPPISPELRALADKIASLSMIDQFILTRALAERVGMSFDSLVAMAMSSGGGGGGGGGGGARAAAAAAPEAAEKKEEPKEAAKRTAATVRLLEVAADAKYKVLKEVRKLVPAMPLIDCKNLIEKLPADVKADVPIAEAEAAKAAIEAAGGKVELS